MGLQQATISQANAGRDVIAVAGNYYAAGDETDPSALRAAYLSRLLWRANTLSLAGIDPKTASDQAEARLQLSAVYTALLTGSQEAAWEAAPPQSRQRREAIERLRPASAVAQLNQHQRLVLLGDPGSGKSTFVNFVAGCLAGAGLGHETINLDLLTAPLPDDDGEAGQERQVWRHGALLPALVVLRDFAARSLTAAQTGKAVQLWDYITQELADASLGAYAPHLQRTWQAEGGLLLLDGLDELPTAQHQRRQIKEIVTDFAAACPRVRLLVTSRTYAYQQQDWRLPGFAETVLAPFTPGQMRRFVDAWYAHIAPLRQMRLDDARGRAELLKATILGNERLRRLAERPLLLTLMASLHAWRGGSLPEEREKLYNDAVELLLDWWESPKVLRGSDGRIILQQRSLAELLKVGPDKVRGLLHELAFHAHARQPAGVTETADIAEEDLVSGLMRLSQRQEDAVNPALLVEYLDHRAGLIIPRGQGVYTFPHRTFQEYLAACYLADYGYPDQAAELARAEPNRWREVVLLAGAKTARGGAFAIWPLVNALCYEEAETAPAAPTAAAAPAAVWGAHLAGQALVETADLARVSRANQPSVDRVRRRLAQAIRGTTLPAAERALAAASLARLGETRPEVLEVDAMQFCLVPSGPFWMGSEGRRDEEKPLHQVHTPYDYWLGRYPVTNAQFGQFTADGGYGAAAYWPEAAAAGVWKGGQVKGWTGGWRAQPYDFGPRWQGANQPVIGVTWYEALAFCRWLTTRWRQAGWLRDTWQAALPSEAEWEKGARGGIEIVARPVTATGETLLAAAAPPPLKNPQPQRRYPWGEEPDPERANYADSNIGATSGVGCFAAGQTVYGLEEMSGNVWEWTRSHWQAYPYDAQDGREVLRRQRIDATVLRGGAYGNSDDAPRCAFRFRLAPYSDIDDIGFRVVVSPFFTADR